MSGEEKSSRPSLGAVASIQGPPHFSCPFDLKNTLFNFSFDKVKSNVYLSDPRSYIGYDYIKSNGIEQMINMFSIVGISEENVQKIDKNSGGAQYVFSGLCSNFWDKVYYDSENLYKYLKLNNISNTNPIQFWCSDMWAILWNIFLYKKTPIIDRFSFGTPASM